MPSDRTFVIYSSRNNSNLGTMQSCVLLQDHESREGNMSWTVLFQQLHSRSSSPYSHDLANDLVNDLSSGRGRRSHWNRRDAKAKLRTRRLFGADSESETDWRRQFWMFSMRRGRKLRFQIEIWRESWVQIEIIIVTKYGASSNSSLTLRLPTRL